MIKFLRIAAWNVNGMSPNRQEIELFIKNNRIDVLLISETHMTNNKIILMKGYQIYYTNHPDGTSHAGSAIIIKENIQQHSLLNFKQAHLQATVISIDDWQGSLNIASVYCPPRHQVDEQMYSDFFNTLGSRYIAGGDWNSKNTFWGSRLTTTRGRELKKAIDSNSLNILTTGEPTYWPTDPNKTPDLIDFFITKGMSGLYTNVESSLDGTSDHTPVICTLSTTIILKEPRETLYNSKTDWDSFRCFIEENADLLIPLKTEEDIEKAAFHTTNLIQKAAWMSTPSTKNRTQYQDFTLEIREMIKTKRRLRRQWHTSRNAHDKRALNNAQKELKRMLKEHENDTLQEKLKTLSPHKTDDYSLWKITKSLKRPQEHMPPLRQSNGEWARKPADKAQVFANFLKDVFKPNEHDTRNTEDEIDQIIESDQQMSLPLRLCTPTEIQKTIKNLKKRKAPGFDLITAEVLNHLPRKGIVLLTILFNAVLRLHYFPLIWKISIINMICKPGKPPSEASSYRPISLLPLLSKLFEKVLLQRLLPTLEDQGTIPQHQFGFRANHGAIEQIHRVIHVIRQSLERKEYCSAVFLDIQQAFDRVWHKGLLCKLKTCLPHPAYMLFRSYLENRVFQVKSGDCLSSFYPIEAGVPQGSLLGPVLYTVYTADLPTSNLIVTATYADDTAILSCDKNQMTASTKLQNHLDNIGTWLKKWRIKASAAKSIHITFSLRKGDCPPVKLGDDILPQKSVVKYLGMHIDRRLTWREHIKTKRDQANQKLKDIHWLIGRQSSLGLENKLLIYKSILKPIWTYGIELWGSASHSNIEILQRFQNKVLKILSNAPWFTRNTEVHEYLQMSLVREVIENSYKTYKERLQQHKNELAVTLLEASESTYRLKRKRIASI